MANFLFMKLLVLPMLSLILDVMTNYIFICLGTDRGHEISIGPKFAPP